MTQFNRENKKEGTLTIGDCLFPAMEITDKEAFELGKTLSLTKN